MSISDNLEWKFSQVFGDGRTTVDDSNDGTIHIIYLLFFAICFPYFCPVDYVSAIEFDDTGDYIAVGDRGGRIVIFEREEKGEKVFLFSDAR
jgi:serine/threonine-protein phosphatase 2A regulatory subunit B